MCIPWCLERTLCRCILLNPFVVWCPWLLMFLFTFCPDDLSVRQSWYWSHCQNKVQEWSQQEEFWVLVTNSKKATRRVLWPALLQNLQTVLSMWLLPCTGAADRKEFTLDYLLWLAIVICLYPSVDKHVFIVCHLPVTCSHPCNWTHHSYDWTLTVQIIRCSEWSWLLHETRLSQF